VHEQIFVDGYAATIMAPGASSFSVSQAGRAMTCRLDLELSNPLDDLDGDGLPDWWQNRFLAADPNADPDGDGIKNSSEFLNGSDPNRDDRGPSLLTPELRAYAEGRTALILRAIDADTPPSNLIYTLSGLPEAATVYLRNATPGATNPDSVLSIGSTFSQADVNAGRVVLAHQGGSVAPTSLQVVLRDE